mmetsp:Transcript_8595/g.26100  ORF Transcript_8595/g.26100 Transcript_8595/m.26100 type:complete len:227 (+) Transcript_8595:928-1608(+)
MPAPSTRGLAQTLTLTITTLGSRRWWCQSSRHDCITSWGSHERLAPRWGMTAQRPRSCTSKSSRMLRMGSGTYCESASKIPIETSFRGTCLRTRRADNAPRHPHSATPESGMQVCGTAFHKSPPAGLLLCSWADYAPDNVGADHRKDGRPAGYDLPSPFASTHEVELSARASVRCLSCTFAPWPVYHTYDAPHVSGYVSSDVKLSAALPCSNFQKRRVILMLHCLR